MKRLFTAAMLPLALAVAFAQAPPQLSGKIVTKAGAKEVLELSFRDQVAIQAGRVTSPVSVPVNKDGTFVFPRSLPPGVTIATTPPCIDLEAILVKPADAGAAPVDLLDQLKPASSANRSSDIPTLGNATQTKLDQFDLLSGLFSWTSKTTQSADKIISGDASLGYGKLGISGGTSSLLGGVNLGCRNEKRVLGGVK